MESNHTLTVKGLGIALLWCTMSWVSAQAQCNIDFTFSGDLCGSSAIQFVSEGPRAILYEWNFGDGSRSNAPNPIHVFPNTPGSVSYQVSLQIITPTNDTCQVSRTLTLEGNGNVEVLRYEGAGTDKLINAPFNRECTLDVNPDPYTTTYEIVTGPGGPYVWDWGDGSAPVTTGETVQTHTFDSTGTYYLTITRAGLSCPVFTEAIEFLGNPTARLIIDGEAIVCEGEEICVLNLTNISQGPVDYFELNWGDGDSEVLSDTLPRCHVYEYTDEDLDDISFSGFRSEISLRAINECRDHRTSSQIDILALPRAEFDWDEPVCMPDPTVCFSNQTSPGVNYIDPPSFRWDFGDPASGDNNTSTEAEPCHSFPGPGTYTVTLTAENGCGTDVETRTVVILEEPVAQVAVSDTLGCAPFEVRFDNLSTPVSGPFDLVRYTWEVEPMSGINIQDSSAAGVTIIFADTGSFIVSLLVESTCGSDIWEQEINVGRQPFISLSAIADTCNAYEYRIDNSVVSYNDFGLPITDYQWEFSDGVPDQLSGAFPDTPVQFGPGNHTIRVRTTNECGTSTAGVNFSVASPVVPFAGGDTSFCLNAAPVILGGAPAGGRWSGTELMENGLFQPTQAAEYELIYTTGVGECERSDSVWVEVQDTTVLTILPDRSVCVEEVPIVLTASPEGGTWSGPDIEADFSVIPDIPGEYAYTYEFTDPVSGCVSRDVFDLIVNPLPEVALRDTIYCLSGEDIDLSGQILQSSGSCRWLGAGIIDPVAGSFRPDTAGTYRFTLVCQSSEGCVDSAMMEIEVVSPEPARVGNDTSLCRSVGIYGFQNYSPVGGRWIGPGVIAGTDSLDLGQARSGLYIYEFGAGSCLSRDSVVISVLESDIIQVPADTIVCEGSDPFRLDGVSPSGGTWSGLGVDPADNFRFLPDLISPGERSTLSYTRVNDNGCVSMASFSVLVDSLPLAAFSLPDTACLNVSLNLSQNSIYANTYRWDFGNGDVSNEAEPNYAYPNTGNFRIELSVSSVNGCVDEGSQNVEVIEAPEALFFAGPDEGCAPLQVNFDDASVSRGSSYRWDFGNGQSDSIMNPGPIIYEQGRNDTLYVVRLSLNNQCGEVFHEDSIRVLPQPQVNFGFDKNRDCSPLEVRFNNVSEGNPDSYVWDFGNGNQSAREIPFNQIYTTDTLVSTYTVSLIGFNECGSDTLSKEIRVLPNTVRPIFETDTSRGCAPLEINFEEFSGAPFISWDLGDGSVSEDRAFSHVYSEAGTYEVQFFANNGCSYDTGRLEIVVYPQAELRFTHNAPVCDGEAVSFSAESDLGISVYNWDFGDGDSASSELVDHIYPGPGDYVVSLSVLSDTFQCSARFDTSIVVRELPEARFALADSQACQPFALEISEVAEVESYVWDFGDGNSSALQVPDFVYLEGGDYVLSLRTADRFGCENDTNVQIRVHPKPEAAFVPESDSVCAPMEVAMINNSVGAVDYRWDFDNGIPSTLNAPVVLFDIARTYDIELISSSQFDCRDTANYSLRVYPQSVAAVDPIPDEGCVPLGVRFANLSTGYSRAVWEFGDGNRSFEASPEHIYNLVGNYEVQLVVDTAGRCGDTLLLENLIQVNPNPIAGFVADGDSLCTPAELNLENRSEGANRYLWDFGNNTGNNTLTPTATYNNAGTYDISLIAINEFECRDTANAEVLILPQAEARFRVGPDEGCAPLEVSFSNLSQDFSRWRWDLGDGSINRRDRSLDYVYELAGTYDVRLIVDTAGKCADTLFVADQIQVNPNPLSDFRVSSDSLCVPASLRFSNLSEGAVRYNWNFGNLQRSAEFEPDVEYREPGSYDISLVSISEFDCRDTSSYEALVYPQAMALFEADPDGICSPVRVQFNNLSTGFSRAQWNLGNGERSGEISPVSMYNTGIYDVELIVDTAGVCGDTLRLNDLIEVLQSPIPDFSYRDAAPDPVSRGEVIFRNESQFASTYVWSFGDGNSSTEEDPTHIYDANGPFEVNLLAIGSNSCEADTTKLVSPASFGDLQIPNAFAPLDVPFDPVAYAQTYKDQGSAAVFHPRGVGLAPDGYEIAIYTKWGKRIWSSTAVDEEGRPSEWWDGTIEGKISNLDVFVWKVHKAVFLGGVEWRGPGEGTVTLLR